MSDIIIRAEGLGKKYVIGHEIDRVENQTLRDALSRYAKSLVSGSRDLVRGKAIIAGDEVEDFWALKDLNFEIRRGEAVGIVGRNGAGKSTLLKLLSRITEPSTGRATLSGRVASLLEVGTGFHPELTGRENIWLNGAILGMSRADIRARFDEIVAFSGVEKFLDTPVKRYSSGMYVRLAFSVAAHLEPDILIVDEVLAVGDIEFQRRCLKKMNEIGDEARTVLFVSHNLPAVSSLCSSAIYLDAGKLIMRGPTDAIIRQYLSEQRTSATTSLETRTDRTGNGDLRFTDFWLETMDGAQAPAFILGQDMVVCLRYTAKSPLRNVFVAFDLRDEWDQPVTNCNTEDVGQNFTEIPAGTGVFRCKISRFPVREGTYLGNVYCSSHGAVCDFVLSAFDVEVKAGDYYGYGRLKNTCRVMVDHEWRNETSDPALPIAQHMPG